MFQIINPKDIRNPKIKLDYNNLHGIGIIIDFEYTDKEGNTKQFTRRTNKTVHINDNNEIEIKTKNTMGTINNLYQYTPDLIFLTNGNADFFNSLKNNFENGNYKSLYGMVSFQNKSIFVLPELEFDVSLHIKEEQKEDKNKELKVYETPEKVFDFFADKIDKSIKDMFIKTAIKKILNLSINKDESLFNLSYIKSINMLKKAFEEKNINLIKDEIGEKKFNENKDLVNFLLNIPDENIYSYLKEHERELRIFKLHSILNIKPLFMDLQAGSGVILKSLENKKFNASLMGTELREINVENENYKVATGVNFSLVDETIKNILSNENRKKMIESVFNYSNPPYSTEDIIGKKSIDTIKQGSLIFGLYPVKMLDYLQDRINGVIYNIPREATGYTDKNTPERFLLVAGVKLNDNKIQSILSRQSRKECEVKTVSTINLNDLKFPESLIEKIQDNLDYSKSANYDNFIKDFNASINNTIENYKNAAEIGKLINENKKAITNAFLPFNDLKRNKVFPDTRFFAKDGKVNYYTFNEVAQNIPLLNFYKKVNPELLTIIKKIADDLKYPLPEINDEEFRYSFTNNKPPKKDLITNNNLGMMILNYYPDIIDISDEENKKIMETLIDRYIEKNNLELSGDEIAKLHIIIDKADKIILKNEVTSLNKSIFNNEILVFANKFGQDLGKLEIVPIDFYKMLEEEGYFNLDDYTELANMNNEQYSKIIGSFIDYMQGVKQQIIDFNIKNYKDFYSKVEQDKILEHFDEDLLDTYKRVNIYKRRGEGEKAKGEIIDFANRYHLKDMFEKFFETINTKKIIEKAVKRYKKYLSNDNINNIINLIQEHFIGNEVAFFRTEKAEFFNKINKNFNLEDKLDFENFMLDIEDALSKPYNIKTQIYTGYIRLADILVTGVLPIEKVFKTNDIEKVKDMFEKMFIYKMRLKPHQINEALRYLALEDNKKLEMLFWEMRSGKTRAMLATGFLSALKNKKDLDLIIETANMNDITSQALESFPFLLLNSKFFVGDSDKINVENRNVYSTLLDEQIIPNLPNILQPYLVGKGKKAEELSKTFYTEMLGIIDKLDDKNMKELEKMFENTVFEQCLGLCKS